MARQAFPRFVILGGGSAGWMSAARLVHATKGKCEIELVESEDIGIIGVGEATIPPIREFNRSLEIDETEFIRKTQASFKLGIEFIDWGAKGERYFHPFSPFGQSLLHTPFLQFWLDARSRGHSKMLQHYSVAWRLAEQGRFTAPYANPQNPHSPSGSFDYAYHFDTLLYGRFLREYSEARGVKRTEGKVVHVDLDSETGFIKALQLEGDRRVEGDFFIDCTGFHGVLIEQALKTGYQDWSHWLPADRAVACPSESGGEFTPYTRATAREAGWQWRIPLQHRTGNGYVYSSHFLDDDSATETLLANLDGKPLQDPRLIRFKTGRRNKFWNKNCLAIGLSAGFMEPLESTSLHLIQTAIGRFVARLPGIEHDPLAPDEFNQITGEEYERIRDFIILHYHATARRDSALWRHVASMDIPEELALRMAHFKAEGRYYSPGPELFQMVNWNAVFVGQNVIPERTSPMVGLIPPQDVDGTLDLLDRQIGQVVSQAESHRAFIDRNCRAEPLHLQSA
jgi:tryptophan halogenase